MRLIAALHAANRFGLTTSLTTGVSTTKDIVLGSLTQTNATPADKAVDYMLDGAVAFDRRCKEIEALLENNRVY